MTQWIVLHLAYFTFNLMSNFFEGTSSYNLSERTQRNEYNVLTKVSVRKHSCKCAYLQQRVRRTYWDEYDAYRFGRLWQWPLYYNMRPLGGLQKGKFYLFFCEALQNGVIARHWDWGHREFTHVNDQARMSKITQRVPYYAMVSIYYLCISWKYTYDRLSF